MTEDIITTDPSIMGPEYRETLTEPAFVLQSPHEFRDDFVQAVEHAGADDQIGLETMQFEVNDKTRPMFYAIVAAKHNGASNVRFHYDRVALRHIRAGEGSDTSEAFVALGRTAIHKGDRPALHQAHTDRTQLVQQLEELQIASARDRVRGRYPRMSHNHVKLAVVGDTAWFGTMNLRGLDFEMSNFMVKVTDPESVAAVKDVFEETEQPHMGADREYVLALATDGSEQTCLLLDAGNKGGSIIYQKALEMAASLQDGDEFVMISQWPPVKSMYGTMADTLHAKTAAGSRGTYLLNPERNLHPNAWAASKLQARLDKMQAGDPNMSVVNLARMTHAKAFLIKRKNGEAEVLFGSHNLSSWTVRNGTRELSMWSKDPAIVEQISHFLNGVQSERPIL